jgi:hypothetical protein
MALDNETVEIVIHVEMVMVMDAMVEIVNSIALKEVLLDHVMATELEDLQLVETVLETTILIITVAN